MALDAIEGKGRKTTRLKDGTLLVEVFSDEQAKTTESSTSRIIYRLRRQHISGSHYNRLIGGIKDEEIRQSVPIR
jgi:hypothetical protein